MAASDAQLSADEAGGVDQPVSADAGADPPGYASAGDGSGLNQADSSSRKIGSSMVRSSAYRDDSGGAGSAG
jgi:hypothetical protein